MSQVISLDEYQAHEVRVAVSACQYELETIQDLDSEQKAEIEARVAVMQEVLDMIEITNPNYERKTKIND